MSRPLVVLIPHQLGKAEAIRRLKSGLDGTRPHLSRLLTVQDEVWNNDQLRFRVRALGQVASGTVDIANDHVRLEVVLPWVLALLAERIKPAISSQARSILEKK